MIAVLEMLIAMEYWDRIVRRSGQVLWSWLVPAALFASALIAYLSTLTQQYTFDSLGYAYQIQNYIESGKGGWLVHPHHLLFNPLGLLAWRSVNAVGIESDPLTALQYMNAAIGALGLTLIYTVLRKGGLHLRKPDRPAFAAHPALALAASLLVGAGFGYWSTATDGRVNLPALVTVIVTVGLAWGMVDTPSKRQATATALASALAVGLHQSNGLLVLAGVGVMLAAGPRWGSRFLHLFLYLAIFGAIVSSMYLVAGVFVKGVTTVAGFEDWMLAYAKDGRWWDTNLYANLPRDVVALTHAFVTIPQGGILKAVLTPENWFLRIVVASGVACVISALAHFFRTLLWAAAARKRASDSGLAWGKLLALGLVGLPYAAFFTFWNPGYYVFWLPCAFALVAYLALMYTSEGKAVSWLSAGAMAAVAIFLVQTNLSNTILHASRHENSYRRICRVISAQTGKKPLVVLSGFGDFANTETYLPYFARAEAVALGVEMKRNHGDAAAAIETVRKLMDRRAKQGRDVVVLDEIWSRDVARRLRQRYPAATGDIGSELTKGWEMRVIGASGGCVILRLSKSANPHSPPRYAARIWEKAGIAQEEEVQD